MTNFNGERKKIFNKYLDKQLRKFCPAFKTSEGSFMIS